MPSFLDLPLELRQHILAYTFDEAMEKDILFNMYCFFYLKPGWQEPDVPNWFAKLLLRDKGTSVDDWTDVNLNETIDFAINFHRLALKLVSIHPQITQDLRFVIDERLRAFIYQIQYLFDNAFELPKGYSAYDQSITPSAAHGGSKWTEWWKKNRLRDCNPRWIKWD